MKNILSVIFSGVLMILVGCNSDKNLIENDLTKENLIGDVVLVSNKHLPSELHEICVYDDMGMITKRLASLPGDIFTLIETKYDNGRITTINTSSNLGSGFFQYEEMYSYDINGKLMSINKDNFTIEFKYDEKGRLIREIETSKTLDMELITDYFYSKDKLDSLTHTSSYKFGNTNIETIVNDDNQKTYKSFVKEDDKREVLMSIRNYKRNDKGDFIEQVQTEFDEKSQITNVVKIKYEYDYDEKGNWIQKRTIEEGELKNTEYRTIVYKGGDINMYLDKMEKIIKSVSGGNKQQHSSPNSSNSNSNSSSNNYQRQNTPNKQKCYQCSGNGVCKSCNRTFTVSYYDERSNSWKNRNESRQGYRLCNDCKGAGVFYKKSDYPNQGKWEVDRKCYVGGCLNGWLFCNDCNSYGNGREIGKCSKCKGTGEN
jgi:YD repeat-containing protein